MDAAASRLRSPCQQGYCRRSTVYREGRNSRVALASSGIQPRDERGQIILDISQAEWGYLYKGSLAISAVDEQGRNQYEVINEGDIWYFPKGMAHTVQGVGDENEFLLTFDDGDFTATGTTFNVADWINHTPKNILAKNFGKLSWRMV